MESLTNVLMIVEASGSELEILGTARIFLETVVLGPARQIIEVAVIAGTDNNKEVLLSLGLMKVCDLIHDSFPLESVPLECNKDVPRENLLKICATQLFIT